MEEYLQQHGPVAISELTRVKMRCLLSRRRREKSITRRMELEIFSTFQKDIRQRHLICQPFPAGLAEGTINLMALLADIPVRTLDALHLMIAREIAAESLVTGDCCNIDIIDFMTTGVPGQVNKQAAEDLSRIGPGRSLPIKRAAHLLESLRISIER